MTRRTTDAFLNVNAVIEVGVIGKIVNANPLDWLVVLEACANRFEVWTVRPDLPVTVHARVSGRQSGRGRGLDRRVTVTTINAVITHVVFVTELNRLLPFNPLTGVP